MNNEDLNRKILRGNIARENGWKATPAGDLPDPEPVIEVELL